MFLNKCWICLYFYYNAFNDIKPKTNNNRMNFIYFVPKKSLRHVGYVCPWLGRSSPWYLVTTVCVSARSTLGVDRKLVGDWLGKWSSWYLCTFVGVSARSSLGVDLGKCSSWYAGTPVGVSVWLTLGVDLKLVGAWLGTSISWYLGTSVDVTVWFAFDVDLQQHRASRVFLVLLRYNTL